MSLSLGVHKSAVYDGGGSAATTASVSTSSGSCIIIAVIWQTTTDLPSISDSKGNSWTQIGTSFKCYDDGSYKAYCAFWKNEGGTRGSSHTFTATTSGAYPSMFMQEVLGNTPIVDAVNTGNLDTSSPYQSNTFTPSVANEVLLCFTVPSIAGATVAFTWGDSFTSNGDDVTDGTVYWCGSLGYRTVSSITAYTASASYSGGTCLGGAFQIVGVKETAAAGGLSMAVAMHHYKMMRGY